MDEKICISIDVRETGENILRKIKAKNYSIDDIMKYTGISTEQAVYKWYSGKSLPSLDTLLVLSRILEVDISDLIVINEGG